LPGWRTYQCSFHSTAPPLTGTGSWFIPPPHLGYRAALSVHCAACTAPSIPGQNQDGGVAATATSLPKQMLFMVSGQKKLCMHAVQTIRVAWTTRLPWNELQAPLLVFLNSGSDLPLLFTHHPPHHYSTGCTSVQLTRTHGTFAGHVLPCCLSATPHPTPG